MASSLGTAERARAGPSKMRLCACIVARTEQIGPSVPSNANGNFELRGEVANLANMFSGEAPSACHSGYTR